MAIIKKTFTGTTQAENKVELIEWLEEIGSPFDATADASGNISFSISGSEFLNLYFDGTKNKVTLLKSGIEVESYFTNTIFATAYKTAYGLALISTQEEIIISATKNGSFGILRYVRVTGNYFKVMIADIKNSMTFNDHFNDTIASISALKQRYALSSNLTSFAPVPVGLNDDYFPNLFITPYSEYPATECILQANGKNYVYDGLYALADEEV